MGGNLNKMGSTYALDWMRDELERIKGQAQLRNMALTEGEAGGTWITRNGRRLLNLSSNDYLGLAGDHALAEAVWRRLGMQTRAGGMATGLTEVQGMATGSTVAPGMTSGSTASRLVVGNHPLYVEAEEMLVSSKQVESALIFASGYTANVGVISAVAGRDDVVFSDRLNHASIVDGIILSRARMERYRHNDMDHLESLLRKADRRGVGRKLIVTDAVFSMDGDVAPLAELVELKERYGAMLMIDEAHSGGAFGPKGEGLAFQLGVHDRVDILMGTFGKAYGCYGAYVAGSRVLTDFLTNKARSLVYSTGLPPYVLASIIEAMRLVRQDGWRREQLQRNAALLREGVRAIGFESMGSTAIIPAVVGDNEAALGLSAALEEAGIAGVAIRPPTVPAGTARIRFTVMATHTTADLRWAVENIDAAARRLGLGRYARGGTTSAAAEDAASSSSAPPAPPSAPPRDVSNE